MSDILTALAPILLLILLGFGLKRMQFLAEGGWSALERITYYILFPALLVHLLGRQRIDGTPWPEMLQVVVITLLLAAALLVIGYRLFPTLSGPTFTSIFQGGVRFNTYIAFAVAEAFYGREGLALAAVAAGFMIVLINLLCITAFAVWGSSRRSGLRAVLRDVVANPLIIACAIGWSLSLSATPLPTVVTDTLDIIGRSALLLGLLAVGASLNLRALRGHLGPIAAASLIQFGLKPLLVVLLCGALGLGGIAASVLLIAFMVPTASSATILARQLGGDTETVASIITFQTLFAFGLMPLIAYLAL